MRRYVGGQRLYFDAARPWERATFVVDNSDPTSPKVGCTGASSGSTLLT